MKFIIFFLTLFLLHGIILVEKVETAIVTPELKILEFVKHNSSLTTEKAKGLVDVFISHAGLEGAKWLAATAKVESDFTSTAVGKSGERSMFQILKWPQGKDPNNVSVAIQEALKVKREKELTWKGNKFKALQAYNGNPKLKQTRLYALRIQNYMRYM